MSAKHASSGPDLKGEKLRATLPPVWPEYRATLPSPDEDASLLGVIRFGDESATAGSEVPRLDVPMRPLSEAGYEIWRSSLPIRTEQQGPLRWASNGEALFGTIRLDESEGIEVAGLEAYHRIVELVRSEGFPSLLRLWNHLDAINEEEQGLERYRSFCIGRHQAFQQHGFALREDLPSASAVGGHGPGLHIAFLASREPGIQVENPRQIAAWAYPAEYGPKSPSFSRATIRQWAGEWQIYVAGTASIVGHRSLHSGDVVAQFHEAVRNLNLVRSRAAELIPGSSVPLQSRGSLAKIYLRHSGDAPRIRELAATAFGPAASLLVLEADICRRELLVEIELIVRLGA